jgi:hypothetical protein
MSNNYNFRFETIEKRFEELKELYKEELKDFKLKIDKRGKTYLGQCNHTKKIISITHNYLNTPEDLPIEEYLDTINHEVAHALTRGHKHDKVWKDKCIELGGNGKTCGNISLRKYFYSHKYGCDKGCSLYYYKNMNKKFNNGKYRCSKHKLVIKLLEERK